VVGQFEFEYVLGGICAGFSIATSFTAWLRIQPLRIARFTGLRLEGR